MSGMTRFQWPHLPGLTVWPKMPMQIPITIRVLSSGVSQRFHQNSARNLEGDGLVPGHEVAKLDSPKAFTLPEQSILGWQAYQPVVPS